MQDVLVGQRRIGQVDQPTPVRIAEPSQVQRLEGRLQGGCLEPGPARDIRPAGRPEPGEVAPDEVDDRGRLVDRRLAQPLLGQGVAVGAPLLPRSGWRHADEMDELRKAVPRRARDALLGQPGDELVVAARPVGQVRPDAPHRAVHVDVAQQRRGRAQVPLLAARTRRDGERPVVGRRHHVDRGAHDGRLDDGPILERPGQLRSEVLEPAPQPDVARRGVLRLQAADRFERLGQRSRDRSRRSCRARRARLSRRWSRTGRASPAAFPSVAPPSSHAGANDEPNDSRSSRGVVTVGRS